MEEQPRPSSPAEQIAAARVGSPMAIAELTEASRAYLLMIANIELGADVRAKIGASDIVQEALVTANGRFKHFAGNSDAELRRWMRQILINKISNACRFYRETARRNLQQEEPLAEGGDGADRNALVDPYPTPVQNALSRERADAVGQTLCRLPDRCQELIRLRSFYNRSFSDIGKELNISADAARRAWCRAIDRFRREWQKSHEPI